MWGIMLINPFRITISLSAASYLVLLFLVFVEREATAQPFQSLCNELSSRFQQEMDEIMFNRYCQPVGIPKENCMQHLNNLLKTTANFGAFASKYLLDSYRNYQVKFAHLPNKVISHDELELYLKKAEAGDFQAIFEVYRYYSYPQSHDFSFFGREAGHWLLEAVKLGSEQAKLEMGFDRPYAKETQVTADGVAASLISNCTKIANRQVDCFLYRLKIQSSDQSSAKWSIIPLYASSGSSFIPDKLAILRDKGRTVVELSSRESLWPRRIRKDYFSSQGLFLGSDSASNPLDYFYETRQAMALLKPIYKKGKARVLAESTIDRYPGYQSFVIEERKRHLLQESLANPPFYADQNYPLDCFAQDMHSCRKPDNTPYLKKVDSILTKEIDEFQFVFGYHPLDMPSYVYHGNIDVWQRLAETGDLLAIKILLDFFANPLSFVHGEGYEAVREWFRENLYSLKIVKGSAQYPGLRELLDEEMPATGYSEIFLNPRAFKEPYVVGHKALVNNRLITVFLACEGYDDAEPFHIDFNYRANCYSASLTFQDTAGQLIKSWVYLTEPYKPLEDDILGIGFDLKIALLPASLAYYNSEEREEQIALSVLDGGEDFYDLQGIYLGSIGNKSGNSLAALINREFFLPQRPVLRPLLLGRVYKPQRESGIQLGRHLYRLPTWEDVLAQILTKE